MNGVSLEKPLFFVKATSGTGFQYLQKDLGLDSANRRKLPCRHGKTHQVFPITPEQARRARTAADNVGHIKFEFFRQPPKAEALEPLRPAQVAAL